MKFTYLLAATALFFASCKSNNKELEERVNQLEEKVATETSVGANNENIVSSDTEPKGPLPVITFKEKSYDFGTIQEGEKVRHTFEFTNTGEAPLIIQNASASCGCTVPNWPHEPIAPGKSGKIDVEFNSAGKTGPQNKTVSITANTNPTLTTVNITTVIEAKDSKGPVKN
ncbi:MAG TPA: DUF1573 domain-containing protein [Cytophagales bacterium]|nr:DUF1573 domain-containing protein [Cytophagales bacterium]